jgi:hypothetical protein
MAIIKLTNARLSFPDLFTPTQVNGQGPFAYRAAFLIEQNATVHEKQADGTWKATTMAKVIDAIVTEKWKAKGTKIFDTIKGNPQQCCWYDGEIKSYDGYEGNYVLTSTRGQDKGRPLVKNFDNTPLTEADGKPYAGCYVNATVELWAQDNSHGKGLRSTLRGVQFVKDGDAFSAGTPVSDDEFEEIDAPETADDLS